MRRTNHLRRALLVALAIAVSVLVVGLAAAAPGSPRPHCSHGVSSIGPIVIKDGKVVGGDTVPHTEACLP